MDLLHSLPWAATYATLGYLSKWLLERISKRVVLWLREKGLPKLAIFAQTIFNAMTQRFLPLTYFFAILVVIATALQVGFPVFQTVVAAYRQQILEFASILITGSSVLLGFAFAAESFVATSSQRQQTQRRFISGIQNVETFGVLCVLLSILAIVLNPLGQVSLVEVLLSTAILSLIAQVLLAMRLI